MPIARKYNTIVMPFGRYKGTHLEDLPDQYLRAVLEHEFWDAYTDLWRLVEDEYQRRKKERRKQSRLKSQAEKKAMLTSTGSGKHG